MVDPDLFWRDATPFGPKPRATKPARDSDGSIDLARALATRPPAAPAPAKLSIRKLDFWYGGTQALFEVDLDIPVGLVTGFIGPSGCGKSTLLKCLNRMQDDEAGTRWNGQILMRREGGEVEDIHGEGIDPPMHRRRFGWVAQKPNPFPDSVYENLAYPARLHGQIVDGPDMDAHVEQLLVRTGLWDELKDRLELPGTELSGGQQQRLCIARALSTHPEVLLMDEPCGSLDPISTERIERLIDGFRGALTIILVTHNMEQAARVADRVAFFKMGRVLEDGDAMDVLNHPRHHATRAYLEGRLI